MGIKKPTKSRRECQWNRFAHYFDKIGTIRKAGGIENLKTASSLTIKLPIHSCPIHCDKIQICIKHCAVYYKSGFETIII